MSAPRHDRIELFVVLKIPHHSIEDQEQLWNDALGLCIPGFLRPLSLFIEDLRQMYEIVIDEGVCFRGLSALETSMPELLLQIQVCVVQPVRAQRWRGVSGVLDG